MIKLKRILSHPFFGILIGFFPLLALWNVNKSQIHTRDVWVAVLFTLIFVIIVFGILKLILKKPAKVNLLASGVFILFFSFGHIYDLVAQKQVFGITVGYVKLLLIYLAILILFFVFILHKKSFKKSMSLGLNILMSGLILINLVSILFYNLQRKAVEINNSTDTLINQTSTEVDQQLPDIYYIILDSYSRPDVLKEVMNYDDSAFVDALMERGFFIADCSNSNYSETLTSMTSSLNYDYLSDLNLDDSSKIKKTYDLSNNNIRNELKKYGYQFISSRGFSSDNDIPDSDIYLNYLSDEKIQNEIDRVQFTRLYINTTILRTFFELYYQNPLKFNFLPKWLFLSNSYDSVMEYATYWYNQTNYVFDIVATFAKEPGNYFVYAHINAPHGPYVFDADGNFQYTYNPEDNIPYYINQVEYVNNRVVKLIDQLQENSSTPPIIILQGDHGAHVITTGLEHNKILNAYYLPETAQSQLYNTITPVNTFRIILKFVFNQNIELLPDQVYVKELNNYEFYPSTCDLGSK